MGGTYWYVVLKMRIVVRKATYSLDKNELGLENY